MFPGVEKEFDDEVYEDEFYEENFDEEELFDEEDRIREEDDDFGDDYLDDDLDAEEGWDDDRKGKRKVEMSYSCDDCDYRWDHVEMRSKNSVDDDYEQDVICPMCGSTNISII